MDETPLLQLRSITKSFGSVQALSDVDFEVRLGEVMALVGDNGAGKSTLVKILSGVYAPSAGSMRLAGREFNASSPIAATTQPPIWTEMPLSTRNGGRCTVTNAS